MLLAENDLNKLNLSKLEISPEKLSRTFNRFYNLPRTFDGLQKLNYILLEYLIKFNFHPAIYYLILENLDEMTDESFVKKFVFEVDQKCHNSALEMSQSKKLKLKKNRLNTKLLRILTKFRRLNVLNENNCQNFLVYDTYQNPKNFPAFDLSDYRYYYSFVKGKCNECNSFESLNLADYKKIAYGFLEKWANKLILSSATVDNHMKFICALNCCFENLSLKEIRDQSEAISWQKSDENGQNDECKNFTSPLSPEDEFLESDDKTYPEFKLISLFNKGLTNHFNHNNPEIQFLGKFVGERLFDKIFWDCKDEEKLDFDINFETLSPNLQNIYLKLDDSKIINVAKEVIIEDKKREKEKRNNERQIL